ncbi:hypothetical protein HYT74_03955 [Candidatus Daviesbacteria bacterium]|nr:hypothetical protein [Candidatus Daviesbacteria bacterium]MBI4038812.1 hypothetical protein [Candidatus Daviesbacteria bacterium]
MAEKFLDKFGEDREGFYNLAQNTLTGEKFRPFDFDSREEKDKLVVESRKTVAMRTGEIPCPIPDPRREGKHLGPRKPREGHHKDPDTGRRAPF